MSSFAAERIHVTQEGRINAPVNRVFPLACPYEEYKWIDGWDCDIIYSDSGKIEDGCIFTEERSVPLLHDSDDGATTWYAVLHDPQDFRLHFVLVTPISIIKRKGFGHAHGPGTHAETLLRDRRNSEGRGRLRPLTATILSHRRPLLKTPTPDVEAARKSVPQTVEEWKAWIGERYRSCSPQDAFCGC
jgi:hypothetical protein